MRVRTCIILAILLIIMAVSLGMALRHVSGPRVVARAVAPDGTEMCIVQKFNWGVELFTTSFVFRRPGGRWGWFYFDHQDLYWGSGGISLDTNTSTAVFYRGSAPAVTFLWKTETYTLHRWNRTMTGAQSELPDGWHPEMPAP